MQRRPFQPFRVQLTDGTGYDVRHPELVLLARRSAEIGVAADPERLIADRIVTVSLLHIVRLEPLAGPTGNGDAASA